MSYITTRLFISPGVSPEIAAVIDQIQRELDEIARAFVDLNQVQLKTLHIEPIRPRNGIIVYADGTDWNPGSGEGYYGYYNSAWRKLG